MRCKRDHDIKTAGDITVLEHRADGTCHWRTKHGQTGITPPRPYLPETGGRAEARAETDSGTGHGAFVDDPPPY